MLKQQMEHFHFLIFVDKMLFSFNISTFCREGNKTKGQEQWTKCQLGIYWGFSIFMGKGKDRTAGAKTNVPNFEI